MTPLERRASGRLALIFALRMLGLFLVLPVFALEAANYPGGAGPGPGGPGAGGVRPDAGAVAVAAGSGLGPLRAASASLWLGLLRFPRAACGPRWPTAAGPDLARALQGAGAVSAAVTALLADLTRDSVRTKAMALVGGISIGLMFALALV